MKAIKSITLCLIAILGLTSVVLGASSFEKQSTILYVKLEGTGDCSSWTNACELQTALSLADSGDQVWVATGTYKPTTSVNREATFRLESGVAIYGGFPFAEGTWEERDWETNITTLSGDIGLVGDSTDNSYHVVTGNGVDRTAVLDGFTITAGNANGSTPHNLGGGMYNSTGTPTLSNVIFSEHSAGWGGGMYNERSSPTLTDVTFSGNTAINRGGGIYNYSSSPTLINVTFSNNSSDSLVGSGGGMHNFESSNPTLINVTFSSNSAHDGGGMLNLFTSSPTLTNVTFSGNTATYWGGGIYNSENSNPTLTNVTLSGNTAVETGGGMFNWRSSPTISHSTFSNNTAYNGGGMSNSEASPLLTNVTFSGNTATGSGGGMNNYYFSGIMNNVTFYGNTAILGGGAMKSERSSPTVTNAIFWANTPNQLDFVVQSYPTVSYSIIQDGYAGEGNLDVNPLLNSLADNGSFTQTHALGADSPAIDTGSPSFCPPTDQRGFHRPIDGDANGSEICDMGAYEYDSYLEVFTLAVDVVGSGSVVKNPDKPEYHFGEVVTLTATANPGWTYSGWSGDASGTANPLSIIILGDTSIDANFTQDEYTLTLLVDPISSGSVIADPVQATYHYGDVVTLIPSPNTGWAFTGWSGDATGIENPLEVTISGNITIIANFTDEYTLDVSEGPIGSGSVIVDPIQVTYQYGDVVTLTANPNAGWTFTGWSGDATGIENPVEVTITGNTSITAEFDQNEYTLTVMGDPEGFGSVTIVPENSTYHYGDKITLTAIPTLDWGFAYWGGDASGMENPVTVTIQGDTSITAYWEKVSFNIFLPLIVK
jgi:uncharacterized repeat protein (TIGR02543 family)